ncbi:MAG: hypothetical protein ACPGEC_07540 [Flavobacteriales bacterium]
MFIGILAFVVVALMAFWLMIFLIGFMPFWIGAYFMDRKHASKEDIAIE